MNPIAKVTDFVGKNRPYSRTFGGVGRVLVALAAGLCIGSQARAFVAAPGGDPWNPILPSFTAPDQFDFNAPLPGSWFDPPFAVGFMIRVVGGDMIAIKAPPDFYDLQVRVGGALVEPDFDAGESYTFAPGVRRFSVSGFSLDMDVPEATFIRAFPLWMDFDQEVTQMTWIAAVPEPATYGMLLSGLGIVSWALARRRRTADVT